MKMRKNIIFSEYSSFLIFYNEKYLQSVPAVEGGGGATKISIEVIYQKK